MTFSRALYRARQFFASLRPRLGEDERLVAAQVLGPALAPLFDSMSPRDQRHCLDVYSALRDGGCEDGDLLAAALLHDCGKGRLAGAPIRLRHRVAYVVLSAGAPRLLERVANGHGGIAALHRHAEAGAWLSKRHGAAPAVVDLIARHEERHLADERLRLLRAADDAC